MTLRSRGPAAAVLIVCGVSALVAQEPRPTFEVASIKVNGSGQSLGYHRPTPGRLTVTAMSVVELVSLAYGVPRTRIIVRDGVPHERYDIDARFSPSSTPGGFQDRLQRLLEDRFAVRVHRETRDLPTYVLVRLNADGPLGPNLTPMDACTTPPEDGPRCGGMDLGPGILVARRTWSTLGPVLATTLGQYVDRFVVDRTGLTGWFDFRLEWSPQLTAGPSLETTADNRPSLFAALEEQLGLTLEPTRGPVEVLVIDSAQPPTEN